jgi:hypothetical protein
MYARVIIGLCFAAIYRAHVVVAKEAEYRLTGTCDLQLIWPQSGAVVLIATDSKMIEIFFKLQGNCTEFLRPVKNTFNPLNHLEFFMRGTRGNMLHEQIHASPFALSKPSFAAMLGSPLLFAISNSSECRTEEDWLCDVNGNHDKNASIWCTVMRYSDMLINLDRIHSPDVVFEEIEFYLSYNDIGDVKKPSRTILHLAYFGHPSSYFHHATARYSALSGYACMSACGKMCADQSSSESSPVCTPISLIPNSTLTGPSFKLLPEHETKRCHTHTAQLTTCTGDACNPSEVSFVSIGGRSSQEIGVVGPGRHRLLSVIAEVMQEPVGFILLKKHDIFIDHSRVKNMILKFDLTSSYAFIAFHHRQSDSGADALPRAPTSLPSAEFGSIEDGILLSRAAAAVILSAANDEDSSHEKETIPAECTEFLIFSDAWLCWCASSLGIPSLNIRFNQNVTKSATSSGDCTKTSPLYGKLAQLYEQQRLSETSPLSPPFTEKTSLGFQYFMEMLPWQRAAGPHILRIPDDEQQGSSFFWDECCHRLFFDRFMLSDSLLAETVMQYRGKRGQDTSGTVRPHTAADVVAKAAAETFDNAHLPLVTRANMTFTNSDGQAMVAASIAWIVSGVWKNSSYSTVESLRDVVCAGLGVGSVHFFFVISDTEQGGKSVMTAERQLEIQQMILESLPRGCVMLVTFEQTLNHSGWIGRGKRNPSFCFSGCSDTWCPRLQSAYNYITGTETALRYRYAFIVRSRTDTTWFGPVAHVHKWHEVLPEGAVAGPLWNSKRVTYMKDTFFIFRRSLAVPALLLFPASSFGMFERKMFSNDTRNAAVWGEWCIWPEYTLSYFFTGTSWSRAAVHVLELCQLRLINTFVVDGTHARMTEC